MDDRVVGTVTNSITGLKTELKRLVGLVTEEDDCRLEVLDEISKTVMAIKELKFSLDPVKTDPMARYFLCPISSDLMADPVVLASGQTYDRAYIQEWFDADHVTCPKTEQVLQNTVLTPNYVVQSMIQEWCYSRGLEPPAKSTNRTSESDITPQEAKYVNILLQKLTGPCQFKQREAARELRVLTRKKPNHRVYLGRSKSISVLISLLESPDSETQEHAVTILLNLSIFNENKALIAEEGGIHPIAKVLKNGASMAARENAAATLFSLSSVDENKVKIGSSTAAIPGLVDLLRDGNSRGKKDAASALFNLCINEANKKHCVKAGLVQLLLKFMRISEEQRGGMGDDELLAILALIASCEEGAKAIGEGGGIPICVGVIVKETSPRNKENAVGIMAELCARDSRYVKEAKNAGGYMELLDLSLNGTCKARRKANKLLDRINRQHRLATI
ncbi:hypothetical protein SUGI_0335560 [Cryptomeria japonica]|uniref:U-box domain-containing protein 14 n=1 Tax=Cryptomeria japonica TaxID=3369 RepID=UPI002408CCC0|nr:U-box domain-containing protein 14 [Cryptomeria japonica]XP_059073070.1 U-box domain-containing protein 14 [Cryptomeria japonica]GLJ18795.1 hypothetical protein SUGI_0335560 [Cryptomeria japonica]